MSPAALNRILDFAIVLEDWPVTYQKQITIAQAEIRRLEDKLSRATSLDKRARYVRRIQNAQARILALTLAHR